MFVLCFMGLATKLHKLYMTVNKGSILGMLGKDFGVLETILLKNHLIHIIMLIEIIMESVKCFMQGFLLDKHITLGIIRIAVLRNHLKLVRIISCMIQWLLLWVQIWVLMVREQILWYSTAIKKAIRNFWLHTNNDTYEQKIDLNLFLFTVFKNFQALKFSKFY